AKLRGRPANESGRLGRRTRLGLVVAVLAWLIGMGALSGSIASRKLRNGRAHFFGGLLLGLPWLVVVALLPTKAKDCPHCHRVIDLFATVCPHCQSQLPAVRTARELVAMGAKALANKSAEPSATETEES